MLIKPLLTSILFVTSICSAAFAANGRNGWVLTQHSKVFGDQYLYLSSAGVKCINPQQGIGWLTQAPQWNITFFNEKSKLYYPLSSANWKQKIIERGLVPSNIVWSKAGSGSIAGLKASQYIMSNAASPNSKQQKWSSATYWLADDINVPASLSQLISAACGLPASNSIPLQLSYSNQQGQTENLLTTYRQQSTTIPDQYFSLPVHYKLAKSEVEVLMNQENRALLNDLANDLLHDNSTSSPSVHKLPDTLNLPGGRTVKKEDINKFLNKLNQ